MIGRRIELPSLSDAELVQKFVETVKSKASAIEQDDRRAIARLEDYEIDVYRELRSRGSKSQNALLPLLADENPNVLGAAASYALDFAPERGLLTLQELESLPQGGSASTLARIALMAWRDGNFKIDNKSALR